LKLAIVLALVARAFAQAPAPDPNDLLARAIQLIPTKPGEAVKLLQQALRLDPDLEGVRYQLGLAYHAIGDEADAAAELREAVGRTPGSADAHNYLGIVLFESGDAKSALDEFRIAARLAPKDPNAHFNLGEAMARTGDSAGAVAELRDASQLAPGDAGLARLLNNVETKMAAPGATIKVDVRQVLVPVVVTDGEGHHITGLTQADFQVFEDGVEQRITAFSVEHSGLPEAGIPAKGDPSPSPSPVRQSPLPPSKPRRTYMVLIDTLHTSFNNLAAAREALVKLFRQERSADSQYVVVSLGVSPEMILNVTSDPAAVLAALSAKRIQKIFLDGALGGPNAEMERFRRDLSETRVACDLAISDTVAQAKCAAGLTRLTQQLQMAAELERTVTVGYLRQFRSLVAQLAPARDRRTILLISDGFGIEPGREALALMSAYFPPASHCMVPATVYCPPSLGLQSSNRMSEEFEPILKLAAAANITIDTIDSRGLYGQREFDASNPGASASIAPLTNAVDRVDRDIASAAGNSLREIADATGGTAFHDSNDFLGNLQRAFADGRDYYTLAYVSANPNYDGKFRAITVKVRNRKAVVNAKRGYWAAPSAQ
jgi:VWFA-related protein